MSEKLNEIILAQEQGVINKPIHLELSNDIVGTLIMTNTRLIFVSHDNAPIDEKNSSLPNNESAGDEIALETANLSNDLFGGYAAPLSYTDVRDLQGIESGPSNLAILISSLNQISAHRGIVGRPGLKISWVDSSGAIKNTEFTQSLTGRGRKRNLSDWASVLNKLKNGSISINLPSSLPTKGSLEERILYVLGDMQTKGSIEIEEEAEKQSGQDLDSDDVESSCERLVSMGLVDKIVDPSGDNFYKKRSLLGENDLSS